MVPMWFKNSNKKILISLQNVSENLWKKVSQKNSYLAHCEHRWASLHENCFVIILSYACMPSEEINDNCYIHNSLIEILKKEAIVNGLLSTRAMFFCCYFREQEWGENHIKKYSAHEGIWKSREYVECLHPLTSACSH